MESPKIVTYCSFSRGSQWLGLVLLEGELNQEGATNELVRRFEGLRGLVLRVSVRREDEVQASLFKLMWENLGRWISAADARTLFLMDSRPTQQQSTAVQ